jgi:hypothetical protein
MRLTHQDMAELRVDWVGYVLGGSLGVKESIESGVLKKWV